MLSFSPLQARFQWFFRASASYGKDPNYSGLDWSRVDDPHQHQAGAVVAAGRGATGARSPWQGQASDLADDRSKGFELGHASRADQAGEVLFRRRRDFREPGPPAVVRQAETMALMTLQAWFPAGAIASSRKSVADELLQRRRPAPPCKASHGYQNGD